MVVVRGANLPPAHKYKVGVFTFWNPIMVGVVQTDALGTVGQTGFTYSCLNVLGSEPVKVGFYETNGLAIARTTVGQVCATP
jgi:hypothetical protein